LQELLKHHEITRNQLIDVAILIGTDFNQGVKGIGPKKALKLVKAYGKLENLPNEISSKLSGKHHEIREIFMEPKVTQKEEELYRFLCQERDFSRNRVETAVRRMKEFYSRRSQTELGKWLQ